MMMIFLLHISHDILSEKWPIIQKMLKFPKITRKSVNPIKKTASPTVVHHAVVHHAVPSGHCTEYSW